MRQGRGKVSLDHEKEEPAGWGGETAANARRSGGGRRGSGRWAKRGQRRRGVKLTEGGASWPVAASPIPRWEMGIRQKGTGKCICSAVSGETGADGQRRGVAGRRTVENGASSFNPFAAFARHELSVVRAQRLTKQQVNSQA
ncbi:hypothetical protein PR202_ga01700 [Eleusine coracana subsp. coracana]|uniref:Uncharacterized protein n=1 Tax=Eleusine coracana subsp. coracana TaxID=191504 RepID=A0AAV5BJP3_ELECO|nr:hypothetical protein PR202_ga01013 [Eleusine coracana subsp. coracana]GJM85893.1 hypothetical protein PR202_ga01700 [Eleusine coracana subsp. coracana]